MQRFGSARFTPSGQAAGFAATSRRGFLRAGALVGGALAAGGTALVSTACAPTEEPEPQLLGHYQAAARDCAALLAAQSVGKLTATVDLEALLALRGEHRDALYTEIERQYPGTLTQESPAHSPATPGEPAATAPSASSGAAGTSTATGAGTTPSTSAGPPSAASPADPEPATAESLARNLAAASASAAAAAATAHGYERGLLTAVAAACAIAVQPELGLLPTAVLEALDAQAGAQLRDQLAGLTGRPKQTPTGASETAQARPDTDPRWSTPATAILTASLEAEYAAIYGYGLVTVFANQERRTTIAAALAEHRARRDFLISTWPEESAPAAQAGYVPDNPVTSPESAARLAEAIEESAASRWRDLIEAKEPKELLQEAAAALANSAFLQSRWRAALGITPVVPALPGY